MTNPHRKVAHALTYMEGAEVYEWKRDAEVWILSNPAPSDPQMTIYDDFEFAFIESWTDTNEPYRAAAELDQLRMTDIDIDTYITVFAELARKALYHEDDPAVLEKFKAGLSLDLLETCMHHDEPRNWDAWTRSARKRQAILTSIKTHRPIEPSRTPSPMDSHFSVSPLTTPEIPMEIDKMYTIPMRRTTSEEERHRGLCHLCKQHGHIQRHCPRKTTDRVAVTRTLPAPPKRTRPPQPTPLNQTTVLQYLKHASQKIRDWITDRLATLPPKDTPAPGRLAATRVTKTEAANAFARALKTGATRDAMRVPVTLQTTQKKVPVEAFLDCGANECFISQRFIDDHRLGVRYMKTPCNIENADGSPNAGGSLRYYTDLTVSTGTQSHPLRFYITDIGPDNLVLGYPWFKATNVTPDWKNGTIRDPITIRTLRHASGKPRRTVRIADTTTNIPAKRPMARIPSTHPAFARLMSCDTRERLAVDRHSSRCRFLLTTNGDRITPTMTKPDDATPRPTVKLPRSSFLTTHRNC